MNDKKESVVQPIPQCPIVGQYLTNNEISPTPTPTLQKDSQWLTLEICREHLRNKCQRNDSECKFAHPPKYISLEVHHGRVICCYDYIKGKCNRKSPPCKYLHPPQHLKEQLLQNGRNNLIVKNIQYNIIRKQLQPNSFYGSITPLQINLPNMYHNIQQSTIFPPTTLHNGTNILPYMLPMNLLPSYAGDLQYNYSMLKDNLVTSKPSSLLTNHGLIPAVLIQPLLQNVTSSISTENFHPLLSNSLSSNHFMN